jgi:predicted AAA+ superfamily ATPase
MITRRLAPILAASKKSFLLLGPRQTGKSTLIASLKPELTINLAHEATYLEFLRNPGELEQRLGSIDSRIHAAPTTVFIDEVQRLPSILNTIQALLDRPSSPFRFYLTGSSARKLRRGQANLLPGRIHTFTLGALCAQELGRHWNVDSALAYGTLPGIWTEEDIQTKEKTLRSYASTYLKEEVQAENLARNLEGFARFLYHAAERSGQFLDMAKLASVTQVARQSIVRFFDVLEDCLLVRRLEPFAKSSTRRLIQHPRFYFFDGGVLNGLLGNFTVSSDRMGLLFEHLVVNQIIHTAAAADRDIRLSAYRTEHGAEVDVILEMNGETHAIEIKASRTVRSSDLQGLRSFREYYGRPHRSWIFYAGDTKKIIQDTEIRPWQDGLREIF